jgi:cellulose biosynthesis protein BcsQ
MAGIVPNKFRGNTRTHVVQLGLLREEYGDAVWVPLMLRTAITEATNFGALVTAYRPESYETDEAMRVAAKLLEVLG